MNFNLRIISRYFYNLQQTLYRQKHGKITLVVKFKKYTKRVTATSMAEARMMILTEYKRRYDKKVEIKEAIKTFKEGLVIM